MSRRRSALVSLSILLAAACGSTQPTTSQPDSTATPSATTATTAPDPTVAPSSSAPEIASATPSASASVAAVPAPPPGPLPEGLKILIIGDSFGQALGAGMRNVAGDYKVVADLKAKEATFIPQWAGGKHDVPGLIRLGKPDVVVIAVGGNELAMVDPSSRIPDIEKLVGLMGEIPCVWIRTPTWEAKGWKENDLPEIIRTHSKPCRHYDSNKLSAGLPRGGDHIHPTADGQKIWARQILDWMKGERDPSSDKFKFKPRPSDE